MSLPAELLKAKYVSLTTYKKDGSAVATPVWLLCDNDQVFITTQASSAKVRRIKANPAVTLAPCNARGVVRGQTVAGTATIADEANTATITKRIARKYGLLGWVLTRRGSNEDRAVLIITLNP
jgi:uncharacterized protein